MTPRATRRFWAHVDTSGGLLACWPWTGNVNDSGYGRISLGGGRILYTHRAALELHLGRPIGPGLLACHACDNPSCCNPAHLFEGSVLDNNRDAVAKGRKPMGSSHVQAKLTSAQVARIRAGKEPAAALAAALGVTKRTIYRVRRGDTYFAEGAVL